MLAIVGFVIVIGAILGGYMMHGGHLLVLYQPNEFLIIGGAAIGAMLIGTPGKVLIALLRQLPGIMSSGPSKRDFQDLLVMLFQLLNVARKEGSRGLETHIERPEQSPIFKKYPRFLANRAAVDFLCDTLRLVVMGGTVDPHDLDELMELDLETHHEEKTKPSGVLRGMGDSLPGLGIVAAVLGIVITMGSIDGPPAEIGHKVGAALVGTFLGVLLCYGFVGPLANNLQSKREEEARYVRAIKLVVLAFQKGSAPTAAIEFARRSLFSDVRPGFNEMEQACKAAKAS